MDIGEVQIVDDIQDNFEDNFELIKKIIDSKDQEEAFYILDVGDVIEKHQNWISKIPRVEPHFAIKCNPDPTVIKTLAALNTGFDCASKQEISQVLSAGVSSGRIIFANTMKACSHIEYAKRMGVRAMTVDSDEELHKIKRIFPEANVVIRFRCDALVAEVELGSKSGCDPVTEAPKLVRMTKNLGLNLHGFSFHVGSQCREAMAYNRGIKIALGLINYAESEGIRNVKMIDIGGGFPGTKDEPLDEFADAINDALDDVDPSIRIISEPGTYFVGSAFTLACSIIGKRIVEKENQSRYMYYINDGIYGSFIDHLLTSEMRYPIPLNKPKSDEKHLSTIWGPTLDTIDCVIPKLSIPEFHIGDWLIWRNMGSYTIAMAGTFNGIPPPAVFPFIRRWDWKSSFKFSDTVIDESGTLNERATNGMINELKVIG